MKLFPFFILTLFLFPMLFIPSSVNAEVVSSDYATASYRPSLQFNYTTDVIIPTTGDGEITDDMFGFIIVILLITGMNVLGTKTGYLMLSVFAILGMIVIIPMLWQNDPIYIALMLVTTLSNIGLLVYGLTRD